MRSCLRWLSRCHFPLLFLLGTYPLMQTLLYIAFPAVYPCVPFLPLLPLPAIMLCAALPARRRLPAAALLCAMIFALSAHLLPLRANPLLLLLPILCGMLLFFSLSFIPRGIHSISPVFFAAGAAAHIFAAIFFRTPDPAIGMLQRFLSLAFYAYLPLFFLALNRITLDNASLSRFRLPASMQRANILLTFAFLLLSLLVASAPAAARALFALWRAMRSAIRAFGAIIVSFLPDAPSAGGGGIGAPALPSLGDMTVASPSLFFVILEHIASAFVFVVLIIGSAILLRLMVLAVIRLGRRMLLWLKRYTAAVSDDYEDEITDTRGEDGQRQSILSLRMRRSSRNQSPDTPAAHIRSRYARLMKKHAAWSDSSTARENLPQETAGLYEKARYSEHPITREEADAFLRGTKKL